VPAKQNDENEGYGYAYDAMSRLTGGSTGTVCATRLWIATDSRSAKRHKTLVRSVALACAPVDTNGDGRPEMQIVTSNGSAAPPYTITGMRINFAKPATTWAARRLTYNCVSPL
jgi:hypothetical protein